MAEYLRFLGLMKKELYGVIFGILMSFMASFSSVALMGTATWFLSAMAIAGFYDTVLNIFIPSALIRLLALSRTLLRYGERYYTHDATFRLLAYFRVYLFEHALALKIEDSVKLKSADLQRRLQADLERLEMLYIRQLVPFVCAVLMGLLAGGVLLSFSWVLALTALVLMLLAGAVVPLLAAWAGRDYSQQQSTLGVELNNDISDFIHGMFDLFLLGQHYERAGRFLQTAERLAHARSRIIFYEQLSQVALMTCAELTMVFLLLESVPLVLNQSMSAPQMMMFAVVAMASFEVLVPLSAACLNLPYVMHSVQRVGQLFRLTAAVATTDIGSDEDSESAASTASALAASGGALQRFSSVAAAPAAQVSASTPGAASAAASGAVAAAAVAGASASAAAPAAVEVELKHISFGYETAGEVLPVLSDLNLTLRSDLNYVIKGPSGRGKSTLVMLLTRLLLPQSGVITLNGQDYNALKGTQIRSYFAVSLQDIALFSGTILDTFKQIKPDITRTEVQQALELVELSGLISELPSGLDEWLGNTGLALSGGQARRLCLARSLVAAGGFISAGAVLKDETTASASEMQRQFIILDEPGEGLDEEQELRIIERIQSCRKGVIIISHKQAGMRLADQIITL